MGTFEVLKQKLRSLRTKQNCFYVHILREYNTEEWTFDYQKSKSMGIPGEVWRRQKSRRICSFVPLREKNYCFQIMNTLTFITSICLLNHPKKAFCLILSQVANPFNKNARKAILKIAASLRWLKLPQKLQNDSRLDLFKRAYYRLLRRYSNFPSLDVEIK